MKAKPRVLYRGINKDLSKQYAKDATAVWWNVSSCTPNINVAKNFGSGSSSGTMFHVKTRTAVPIMHLSAYQSEEEYILAPGTELSLVSRKMEKTFKPTQQEPTTGTPTVSSVPSEIPLWRPSDGPT
eukprot:5860726-Ditylum_brightwellii.AAC.1